jgi:hypothetical protein
MNIITISPPSALPLEVNKSYQIECPGRFQMPPSKVTGDFIWICNRTSLDLEFDAQLGEKIHLLNGAVGSGFFLPPMTFIQFRSFGPSGHRLQGAWSEEKTHPEKPGPFIEGEVECEPECEAGTSEST